MDIKKLTKKRQKSLALRTSQGFPVSATPVSVAHDVIADITFNLGPEIIVIDFAVVSPGASQYMEYPTLSPTV